MQLEANTTQLQAILLEVLKGFPKYCKPAAPVGNQHNAN